MTDVNQAFAAERAEQIASAYRQRDERAAWFANQAARFQERIESGNMRDNGNGTYTVTGPPGSYDIGETFRVQGQPGEIPLILPQTGLDEVDGVVQLYSAVETWHQSKVTKATTDIGTVLKEGGLDWLVMQEPVFGAVSGEFPGKFINYRSDNKFPLGVVGKIFTPAHPREQLAFLQELAERYDVPFESAGPLNGGKQVFVSMRVPDSMVIDRGGLDESVTLFLVAFNYNDGEGKLRVVATPWRPVCGNTNRFALRDAVASWGTSHTKNWKDRVDEARRQLTFAEKYADSFEAEETQLARTAISLGEVEQLIQEVQDWADPGPEATTRKRLAYERRLDDIFERFALEAGRVGRTAYAAENAITGHLDHGKLRNDGSDGKHTNMAAARATANLLGADDKIKSQVHKRLMTLAS